MWRFAPDWPPFAFTLLLFKPPLICLQVFVLRPTEGGRGGSASGVLWILIKPAFYLLLHPSPPFDAFSPLCCGCSSSSSLHHLPCTPMSFPLPAGLPPCDIQSIGTGMDGSNCWLFPLLTWAFFPVFHPHPPAGGQFGCSVGCAYYHTFSWWGREENRKKISTNKLQISSGKYSFVMKSCGTKGTRACLRSPHQAASVILVKSHRESDSLQKAVDLSCMQRRATLQTVQSTGLLLKQSTASFLSHTWPTMRGQHSLNDFVLQTLSLSEEKHLLHRQQWGYFEVCNCCSAIQDYIIKQWFV